MMKWMKKVKRLLGTVLLSCFLVTLLPAAAWADIESPAPVVTKTSTDTNNLLPEETPGETLPPAAEPSEPVPGEEEPLPIRMKLTRKVQKKRAANRKKRMNKSRTISC